MFKKQIALWLFTGLILVYFQIILGGITRLTGSGLSITKWDIVMGTLPPLNQAQWQEAFSLYKLTPQYEQINEGMSLRAFKTIYFWEYLHRLWARAMGIIFLLPLIFFIRRKWIRKGLLKDVAIVFLLAVVVASFGWIMVASGLVDRPWVSAYKLTLHLSLALLLFGYLLWTYLKYVWPGERIKNRSQLLRIFFLVLILQILFGGLMSGVKASLVYPTFPDYGGDYFPQVLLSPDSWNVDNFIRYERSALFPALVQLFHRTTGYVLLILGIVLFVKSRKDWQKMGLQVSSGLFISLLVTQVLLGISVLIKSIGIIPVGLGVLHQAVAILLLCCTIYLLYFNRRKIEMDREG